MARTTGLKILRGHACGWNISDITSTGHKPENSMPNYDDVPMSTISLKHIQDRAGLLSPHVVETPSVEFSSPRLSPLLGGGSLFLKLESLQKTGTFKARGALSRAMAIPESDRHLGITAASAGNHAIAAAWAANHIGVSAKVVMMGSANPYRVARAKMLGADVVMMGGGSEAMNEAERLERDENRTYIHPFEGPFTTLGAAGVGLEFATQVPDMDAVVVAVGGGGLISGVSAAIKQLNPKCAIYGVEPEGANSMQQSFAAGHAVALDGINTLADSLGAPSAMPFSYRVCREFVDEIVTVNDDQICAGVVLYQEEAKLAVEPAAGAALAAVFGPLRARLQGKRIGVVVCGANIDAASYVKILARGQGDVQALLAPDA
ncbi:MAG: threonine dehydratase [Candidatus Paceibacteria bacterium]|jgi:threonine dehydratase